jgi:hypothetical protein
MKKALPGTSLARLAWLAAWLAAPAWSAEPPVPKEPEERPFVFRDEGRDPFCFWGREQLPTREGGAPAPVDEERIKEAKDNYQAAEARMLSRRFAEAVQHCDDGVTKLNAVSAAKRAEAKTDELYERFFRLRRAADRLQKRMDAEKAFKSLNLKVTGVVAREHRSMAIINNQTVGKGGLIKTETSKKGAVYVDDIRPNRVVLRFSGFRMELPMEEPPPQ